MKKRRGILLLIVIFFVVGIVIGSQNPIGTSNYFEESKSEFEENITKPDNQFSKGITKPTGNLISKIALEIDEKIQGVFEKLFR